MLSKPAAKTMQEAPGIIAYASYLPAIRLERRAIAGALDWALPHIKTLAGGRRTVADWDEDTITMAVAAGRQCLHGRTGEQVSAVTLASTTFPFADRSNSGIVREALNLPENISNDDAGGSRRGASAALLRALNRPSTASAHLLLASDCREARPGSAQEINYGHAAAALLLGKADPLAVLVAGVSLHRDLVDQFRSRSADYDYALEERWVRDEGYMKLVPEAVGQLLSASGCKPDDVHHFALAGPAAIARIVSKRLALTQAKLIDPLHDEVGDAGAARPILMLNAALAQARPGQHILLVGFGQGVDALLLKTTDWIKTAQATNQTIDQAIRQGRNEDNYLRYLVLRQQLQLDYGLRAERDNRTALPAFYRRRAALTGFIGGRCRHCDMLQFPRSAVCVRCHASDSQAPEPFAGLTGRVKSFTEDWQAYTPCPPLIYGNVGFPGGANVMMEFSGFAAGQLAVDAPVRMVFRIKDYDQRRDFRRYFWKAAPLPGVSDHAHDDTNDQT